MARAHPRQRLRRIRPPGPDGRYHLRFCAGTGCPAPSTNSWHPRLLRSLALDRVGTGCRSGPSAHARQLVPGGRDPDGLPSFTVVARKYVGDARENRLVCSRLVRQRIARRSPFARPPGDGSIGDLGSDPRVRLPHGTRVLELLDLERAEATRLARPETAQHPTLE